MLNLAVAEKVVEGKSYMGILAKSSFEKYDIIAEIRGSLIRESKVEQLVANKEVDPKELPSLLYLQSDEKYLLRPKNITKYIFSHPLYLSSLKQHE